MNRKDLLKLAREERIGLMEESVAKKANYDYGQKAHTPWAGLSTYSLINKDGKVSNRHIGGACYAGIEYNDFAAPMFLIDLVGKGRLPKKIAVPYVDWWVRESLFSEAFVTKDADVILNQGVILDCQYSCYHVMIAAVGLRYMREMPEIVERWDVFRKYVSPDAAIVLAHLFSKSEDDWISGYRSPNSGHLWWQKGWWRQDLHQIVSREGAYLDKRLSMTKKQKYRPLVACLRKELPREDGNYYGGGEPNVKHEILYPKAMKKVRIKNDWGEMKETNVYSNKSMKKWLNETINLNMEEGK